MFFDDRKLTSRGAIPRDQLRVIERPIEPFEIMSGPELVAAVGDTMIFDVECYINYFLVSFRHEKTGKVVIFENSPDAQIDLSFLGWMLYAFLLVGFNSKNYDIVMAFAALQGLSCGQLKEISDAIIIGQKRPDEICEEYGFYIDKRVNHIDIAEVCPLPGKKGEGKSLKVYAARLHAKRLQDLPYDPACVLTYEQAMKLRDYNINADLPNTELIYQSLTQELALRQRMTVQYGEDLRSKSDAQISEVVIVNEAAKLMGRRPKRASYTEGETFFYRAPAYVAYRSAELQTMLQKLQAAPFVINEFGSPKCETVQEISVVISGVPYAMGLGGLHSRETCRTIEATETHGLSDIDVASYYPRLTLNEKLAPESMGPVYGAVLETLVDRRLAAKGRVTVAKKAGLALDPLDVAEQDGLKIVINGAFGKSGSPYSMMYAPRGMIQVTLGGQVSILMLIEWLTDAGFAVVSANTDGIAVYYDRSRRALLEQIVAYWGKTCNLETEETQYRGMYQRDVNNYIAVTVDGEVKLKGKYAEKGSARNSVLAKNPEAVIISDALVAYITKRVPIMDTLKACTDIRRFVVVRNCSGGAQKDGYYLGKVVRYYYGKNSPGVITYVKDGNAVANSDGATPCMDLPDAIPPNIDLDRYLAIATEELENIGLLQTQATLF